MASLVRTLLLSIIVLVYDAAPLRFAITVSSN